MVMVVVELFFPSLSVLAAPGAPRTVATFLVATVPPLSWQRWRCGFVLQVGMLQDGRRAQLRRLAERLGGLEVP